MKITDKCNPVFISLGGSGGKIMEDLDTDLFPLDYQLHINTDRNSLRQRNVTRFIIGEKCIQGNSCSRSPTLGKQAIDESIITILTKLINTTDVFIIAGLGGGTGSAAPHLAKLLIQNGKKVHLILSVLGLDSESNLTHQNVENAISEANEIEPELARLLIMKQDWSRFDKITNFDECLFHFHQEIAEAIVINKDRLKFKK